MGTHYLQIFSWTESQSYLCFNTVFTSYTRMGCNIQHQRDRWLHSQVTARSLLRVCKIYALPKVANAAIERLGEAIIIDLEGTAYCENKITGAFVSTAPVSKSDASFMQKHMMS